MMTLFSSTQCQRSERHTLIPFQYEQITPINACMYSKHTHNSNVYQMSPNEPESSFIERVCSCMLFLCMHKRVKVHQIYICILLLPFLCNMHTHAHCDMSEWTMSFSTVFDQFWKFLDFFFIHNFFCLQVFDTFKFKLNDI